MCAGVQPSPREPGGTRETRGASRVAVEAETRGREMQMATGKRATLDKRCDSLERALLLRGEFGLSRSNSKYLHTYGFTATTRHGHSAPAGVPFEVPEGLSRGWY